MTSIEWLQHKLNNIKPTEFCSIETIKEWVEQAKEMHKQEMEISDEEIEKAALDYDNGVIYGPPLVHFEQGAFWYREQLKQRQCNK